MRSGSIARANVYQSQGIVQTGAHCGVPKHGTVDSIYPERDVIAPKLKLRAHAVTARWDGSSTQGMLGPCHAPALSSG